MIFLTNFMPEKVRKVTNSFVQVLIFISIIIFIHLGFKVWLDSSFKMEALTAFRFRFNWARDDCA
ncbi:hypothetical protein AAUPMB_17177 [Pasteurella multocida subsp. multocida str. Anand1_buffalo]|nr:hypothetical protein AAUPMB_17177 [Pasteurella multocida subsp. multocida str. Anand1_buffalo]